MTTQCDNGEGFNYHGDTDALMPFYRHVIEQARPRAASPEPARSAPICSDLA